MEIKVQIENKFLPFRAEAIREFWVKYFQFLPFLGSVDSFEKARIRFLMGRGVDQLAHRYKIYLCFRTSSTSNLASALPCKRVGESRWSSGSLPQPIGRVAKIFPCNPSVSVKKAPTGLIGYPGMLLPDCRIFPHFGEAL